MELVSAKAPGHLLSSTMMPFIRNIRTRTGCRPTLASLSFPRQGLIGNRKHALQAFHHSTRCATTSPRTIYSVGSINRSTTRRFASTSGDKSPTGKSRSLSDFWKSYLEPVPMPDRWSAAWYREMVLICTVFAITGSSTMVLVSRREERTEITCIVICQTKVKTVFLCILIDLFSDCDKMVFNDVSMVQVRPAVSKGLGLKGSFKDGPWSFRICSLVVMTPIYATLLLLVGTVFGRHAYFRHFSVKMWSRFGIPPEMIDKSWHTTKKNFRKW